MTDTTSDQVSERTAAIDLTGRVVIVTGASRGIGKGLAIGLAAMGAKVVCAARTVDTHPDGLPGTIHETVAQIEDAGGERPRGSLRHRRRRGHPAPDRHDDRRSTAASTCS